MEALGDIAILSLRNFFVFIRAPRRNLVLYPQLLVKVDGVSQYTLDFSARARRFIGWLPYYNKRWEMASDKLLFKAWASYRSCKLVRHTGRSAGRHHLYGGRHARRRSVDPRA